MDYRYCALIRPPPTICPASPCSARLRPAAAGSRRVGGRSCSQPSLYLPSTCPPLSPRALTRARYGGAALGLPSRASSCPCSDQPMALSARACCAGVAAKRRCDADGSPVRVFVPGVRCVVCPGSPAVLDNWTKGCGASSTSWADSYARSTERLGKKSLLSTALLSSCVRCRASIRWHLQKTSRTIGASRCEHGKLLRGPAHEHSALNRIAH